MSSAGVAYYEEKSRVDHARKFRINIINIALMKSVTFRRLLSLIGLLLLCGLTLVSSSATSSGNAGSSADSHEETRLIIIGHRYDDESRAVGT